MKREDKKHLKRFWLGKGLLLASIIGSLGMAIVAVPFIHSHHAMVKEAEVPEAMKAFPGLLLKDLESTEPEIFDSAAVALGHLGDKRVVRFFLSRVGLKN